MSSDRDRVAVERWFTERGVPHFVVGYSATEDVLTRALPALTLIFLVASVSAIDLDWPGWGIGVAIAGGFGVLLAVWAGINWLRGRPKLSPPSRVGGVEIGVFLLGPPLLPILFGGDGSGAVIAFGAQLVLLGMVYLVVSYGVVAIARWAVGQVVRSLGQTVTLFARGLPLLLLGFTFLFVNAEAWQAAGLLDRRSLLAVFGLFATLAALFVVTQIPREIGALADPGDHDTAIARCAGTPAVTLSNVSRAWVCPPLTRREWGNVGLVVLISQALRILLVAVLVGAFFVAFGLLLVREPTITSWTGQIPSSIGPRFGLFGVDAQMTVELLQVSAFLSGFAGLYFSVYTMTEATFRQEFFQDIADDVGRVLAARAVYRSAVDVALGR